MLTDEIKIKITAGRGGDGIVTFSKIKMVLGPTGGRGGNGGNVYFEGVSDLTALNKFRNKKEYWAEDGEKGKSGMKDGHAGNDLTLRIPVGSFVRNEDTGEEFEVKKVGEKVLVAKGGIGGRGNLSFKSPKNTSPQEFEEGKPGEEFNFYLELRLIADVGLIGFPNAGKSSLLNELTKAHAKVANYSFTTLEPNLGVLENIIIADIPGLIEGASAGKGLGIKFLKHIKRTKLLAHCISLESKDIKKDYRAIRKELEAYDPEMIKKKEILLITKTDLVTAQELAEIMKAAKKINPDLISVSIHDWDSIQDLKTFLIKKVAENQ